MLSKRHTIFNAGMILVPWASLLFMRKHHVRRFFPAALIVILFELVNAKVGQKRKWWVFYDKPKSFLFNELPFNLGPFLPGSIWILKLTYGNFKNFLLLNAAVDGAFAFVLTDILRKLKIAKLSRLNEMQFFIYLYYKVFLLYGAQYVVEKARHTGQKKREIQYRYQDVEQEIY